MATTDDNRTIRGIDNVGYLRLLKNAHKEAAKLIRYQTSMDFELSRDSDTTATKDGSVAIPGAMETEVTIEFLDGINEVSDDAYTAILNGETVELWKVNRARKNDEGKYFGWYMQGEITGDSNSNDADDASTRELTVTVSGTPKRGWLTLSKDQQEELEVGFRGLKAITEEDPTGDGTAFNDADAGKGSLATNE